jgi:hypothetical protein
MIKVGVDAPRNIFARKLTHMSGHRANKMDRVETPRRAESHDPILNRRSVDESLLRAGIDLTRFGFNRPS